MAKVRVGEINGEKKFYFKCPGCGYEHKINDKWDFNGDLENPTFKPSVLMRTGHYMSGHDGDCWCTYEESHGEEAPFECRQCHSFITDGKIRFLNDCSHALAGQTVELPEIQ